MTECWLPVVGYEGNYEVSDHGRVRSVLRMVTMKNGVVRRTAGTILQPAAVPKGHLFVGLSLNGRVHQRYVHHLVLEAFDSPCPPGMECRHRNGNPADNYWPRNICWGTKSENNLDTVQHGTHRNARKTCCPMCGGPYDIIRQTQTGLVRRCGRCMREKRRASDRRRRRRVGG